MWTCRASKTFLSSWVGCQGGFLLGLEFRASVSMGGGRSLVYSPQHRGSFKQDRQPFLGIAQFRTNLELRLPGVKLHAVVFFIMRAPLSDEACEAKGLTRTMRLLRKVIVVCRDKLKSDESKDACCMCCAKPSRGTWRVCLLARYPCQQLTIFSTRQRRALDDK